MLRRIAAEKTSPMSEDCMATPHRNWSYGRTSMLLLTLFIKPGQAVSCSMRPRACRQPHIRNDATSASSRRLALHEMSRRITLKLLQLITNHAKERPRIRSEISSTLSMKRAQTQYPNCQGGGYTSFIHLEGGLSSTYKVEDTIESVPRLAAGFTNDRSSTTAKR